MVDECCHLLAAVARVARQNVDPNHCGLDSKTYRKEVEEDVWCHLADQAVCCHLVEAECCHQLVVDVNRSLVLTPECH